MIAVEGACEAHGLIASLNTLTWPAAFALVGGLFAIVWWFRSWE